MAEPLADSRELSIVIPVLNEAGCLEVTLERLFDDPAFGDHCEVLICDGGSIDGSLEIANRYPCRIVRSARGRARQMNAGARAALGSRLLFLHADTLLANDQAATLPGDASWGFFRLRLAGKSFAFRVIETAINLRSRLTRVATGDQGLFFERKFFDSLGGFPEIPLMEDVAISKLARRQAPPIVVATPITTSSRRWRRHGIVGTVLLMWLLRFGFWIGVDPGRLHRIYYPGR